MPSSQAFSYIYRFDSGGKITDQVQASSIVLMDTPDGPSDDPNVLAAYVVTPGQSPQYDNFSLSYVANASPVTMNFNYAGMDTSSGRMQSVYGYNNAVGNYMITNTPYALGQQVSISNSPYTIVCFISGTLIRTAGGEIAVEALAAGDVAVTASGEHRPIRWIGSRAVNTRRHPRPHEVMPVRIRAGAFGPSRPARDLVVSPGHALCLDICGEVLVPAIALLNGSTVVQEEVETVTYWHVELDSHDILIAENMPAESYLDMGNRGFFAGGGVVGLTASPDAISFDAAPATHANFCRPFHSDGPLIEAIRMRLSSHSDQHAQGIALNLCNRVSGLCA